MKIIREDFENSFQTMLTFQDGNNGQEIMVYSWQADTIEQAIKVMTWQQIKDFKTVKGIRTIKEE